MKGAAALATDLAQPESKALIVVLLRSNRPKIGEAALVTEDRLGRSEAEMARRNLRFRGIRPASAPLYSDAALPEYTPWTITPPPFRERRSPPGRWTLVLLVAAASAIGVTVWFTRFGEPMVGGR